MININKILQDIRIYKILAVLSVVLFFLIFPSVQNDINKQYEQIYLRTFGKQTPDSNIVIIKIDETTINSLSGWPLKRSYYALALKYLNELKAKKIGVEILLANSNSAVSIYNNLLVDEVKKNPNIIFASLLTDLKFQNKNYISDSLILPEFNEQNLKYSFGHINYISEDGLYLPLNVKAQENRVDPLSAKLADWKGKSSNRFLRIKLNKSWRDYKNIELIDFLKTYEQNPEEFAFIQNKIVLIGVTDEMIAKNIDGIFDSKIPGVGFHAICTDNFINYDTINTDYKFIGSIILLSLILAFSILEFQRREIYYTFLFTAGLFFLGLIFYQAGFLINYSLSVFPATILFFSSMAIYYFRQKSKFISTLSENKILNQILLAKETELAQFQKKLLSQDNSDKKEYEEKIQKLNAEIELLKKADSPEPEETASSDFGIFKNFEDIIYKSNLMQKVVDLIKRVAQQNVTVLIQGESGTGKELVARAVHNLSQRKNEKFVAINCAALSDSLLESELFGHVKGAFTNAIIDKKGLFEAADKGTIFLDEIGETSENFQAKLLRVLQSGEIQKVGSAENIFVDVRVIAATNKNLTELVKQKRFRQDLFFRLNVIQIELPSLKERTEDINCLAEYFTAKENPGMKISDLVHQQLINFDWKGNVRELQSVIKRAVIYASSENRSMIKLSDLPESLAKLKKADLESMILNSLREKKFSHTSINETARELGGINRNVVSEHLRGIFFKNYVLFDFDFNKALMEIAANQEEEFLSKLKSKCETYINNLKSDLENISNSDFNDIKLKFSSKYRNLPQKYHTYLDEVIKFMIGEIQNDSSGI